MSETEDFTPGQQAFVLAFFGSIVVVVGLLASLFFWPLGFVLIAFGGLIMVVGSPMAYIGARKSTS